MSYTTHVETVARPAHRTSWQHELLMVISIILVVLATASLSFVVVHTPVDDAAAIRQFEELTGNTAVVQSVSHAYFTSRYTDVAQYTLVVDGGEIKIVECTKIGLLSPQLCTYNS